MAPAKKESSVELCSRVNAQGNTIAIRMLEYLSTSKRPVHGFQQLATEFIELCEVLWSIEAGLAEVTKTPNGFPVEVAQELDKRIRQVSDEFTVLSHMVNRFVDNENHKGGFGRKFKMMFADTDIDKMRTTLSRSRDSLKVSSAMFRWTLGDARADSTMGIGYAGLIAALERLNPGKTLHLPPSQPPPTTELPPVPPSKGSFRTESPYAQAQAHRLDKPSFHDLRTDESHSFHDSMRPSLQNLHLRDDESIMSPSSGQVHATWRAPPSARSSDSTRDTMYRQNLSLHDDPVFEESTGDVLSARALLEGKMHGLSVQERYMDDGYSSKVDSAISTGPNHWGPRQSGGSKTNGGKAALVNAVEQRKHRLLEQLLDGGARAEPQLESGMLRIAVQNRDVETIALLLRYGVDANNFDRDGFTPLFAATRSQCLESARVLVKHGADPNLSAGPESESPLSHAASHNYIEFVQLFLNNGGDAGFIMENGSTALVQCINKTVSTKVLELMLNSGADPNAKNGEGTTALFQGIQANRLDLITILLDHGANPNLPGPKHPLWPSTYKPQVLKLLLSRGADHKKTPGVMELASSLKKLESVKILVEAGVSPNIRKDGVYTPLCSAIRDNSQEIVTYLLENGADPNFKSAEYPTFKCITHKRLHMLPQVVAAGGDLKNPKGIIETAVQFNDKDAIVYLLEQGVNINDRCPEGNTALTTAIRDDRADLVDFLLARGADPAVRGADWPLCMAVKRPAILKRLLASTPNPKAFRGVVEMAVVANQLESIKLLLNAGVSVEDKNCGVFSPLTTAIREDHKDIVRYLLDVAGADPNAPGEHLPLVKALRRYHGDPEMIQMLLTRGADINKMHRGWNAVLQAAENGDAHILKLLIEMGGSVDLQAIDESGKPVIDIVTERGWEEGLALLFPNASQPGAAKAITRHNTNTSSISDWKWISAGIEAEYRQAKKEEEEANDRLSTVSSGILPA